MTDPTIAATDSKLAGLLDMEIEWFYSTKEELSPAELLSGLLDYGLFVEKVPPCFTTKGLAAYATEKMLNKLEEADDNKLRENIDKCAHDYIRYETLRDINIPRHLGIPHPEAYAIQALAISNHWKEIATHCNKPKPTISRIHVRHVGVGRIFEMNYKGSERYQHEEEDIQWMAGAQFLVRADIASCFASIYTHSIPWALHEKVEAKKSNSLNALTGNLLDKCTQNTRDKQTNGLLIGPHASNIISEIVLTRIDAELQVKSYQKLKRYIDDYEFYADTYEQAEKFIKDLGLCLRAFEMSINDKKTHILELPRPSTENWIQMLNRFAFPNDGEVKFATVRSYLDLALECSQAAEKSTPLNYAIKTLAGKDSPRKLNSRAKRLYAQEAMNLALSYPYLVPLLDEFVFDRYWHDGLQTKIADFSTALVRLGIRKLYPDTIAHALYYALKHNVTIAIDDADLSEVVVLDDCIANVLLLEYATKHSRKKVMSAIKNRAKEIKSADAREKDKNWLLIYQVWSKKELQGNGQVFLAELKNMGFQFLAIPIQKPTGEKPIENEVNAQNETQLTQSTGA